MTKNVVQRLQTINQDLSSIISIYDLTSETKKSDDESQKKQTTQKPPEVDTSECSESSTFCNQIRHLSHTLLDSVKKRGHFVTRPSKSIYSDETMSTVDGELQKRNKQKPGSAPTSFNTAHQSDYTWRQSLGLSRNVPERNPPKGKAFQTLWYDSRSCMDCEEVKTPSEILETTNNNTPMKKNNDEREERRVGKLQIQKTACKFGATERQDSRNFEKTKSDFVKSVANLKKENSDGGSTAEGGRPFSPRAGKPNASEFESGTSDFLLSSTIPKPLHGLRKDSRSSERSGSSPTRVPRPIKSRTPSPDPKINRQTTPAPGTPRTKKEEDAAAAAAAAGNDNKCPASLKFSERVNLRVKQAEKIFGDKSDEKKSEREKKLRNASNSQKVVKDLGEDGMELLVNETSAILSKSIEKLEKLKLSKELALNTAKQLKEKCDDLRQSKEELIEKLQRVEKENKRLSSGLKAAEMTEKKLQLKLEGLQNDSKNKLTEQETMIKTCEKEKQHNEEQQTQKERFHKNMMKVRESRMGDLHRLVGDKKDLQIRVDELRDLLTQSNLRTEKLEEEIRRLQHLHSQTEQLQKKKESQETQNELESIRQNSKDLEEQVKTLRKSIEAFDEVQQQLITQTKEYQKQMQSGLEEIEKLRNENTKLKADLENEKDALLIKIKIIEDQQETIKQLKSKSEEVKTLLKKNQSLERILNIEREEKLELEEAVEHLNRRKEELKKKIKTLENDLLLAPQEVVKDLQKTQIVLHELENQVQAKQKEWEFHLQCLVRQKEQACNVAEFATKKLMRTTSEFQKQTEAYKALQKILAENMKEKLPADVGCLRDIQN